MAMTLFLATLLSISGVHGLRFQKQAPQAMETLAEEGVPSVPRVGGPIILHTMLPIEGKPVVQNLRSDEGMAYYGSMFVGGQEQIGVYDTGSFELVVESKCLEDDENSTSSMSVLNPQTGNMTMISIPNCCSSNQCPNGKYSPKLSGANFAKADDSQMEQITYGSGPVMVKPGYDHVQITDKTTGKTAGNSIAKEGVKIKIIVDHDVDLFKETEMTSVVGVGPGKFEERDQRLLYNLGIKRFMVCFQENAKADGFWTWNDRDRSADANWKFVPVAGKQFWAVPTSKFMIDGTDLGCNPSCGGVIDTGTSLLTPPLPVINALREKLENGTISDCSDLSKFPDLQFQLGDHTMSLPPSSYLADAGVQTIEVFHQQLAFAPLPMSKRDLSIIQSAKLKDEPAPAVHACVMLLSPGDESEVTQFGPMVIFGMSLFRKYAAQFDFSADLEGKEDGRAMRFAEASPDCSGPATGGDFRLRHTLQKVNLDKMRISPLQQRLLPRKNIKHFGSQLFRKGVIRI